MIFGMNKTLLLGAGSALVLAGASYYAYDRGYNNGSNSVQTQFDEYVINAQEAELAYKNRVSNLLKTINNQTDLLGKTTDTKVITETKVVRDVEYRNRDVIQTVFRDTPFLSKGWVYTHDQLVRGEPIDPVQASVSEPSRFTEEDSLSTISENYTIARERGIINENWRNFYIGLRTTYSLPNPAEGDSTGSSTPTIGPSESGNPDSGVEGN